MIIGVLRAWSQTLHSIEMARPSMKHEWPVVEERVGSRQWIFDRVVRHYRAQPRRCYLDGRCAYRYGDDRCFVGVLIDDAHYRPGMEGYRANDVVMLFPVPKWFLDNIDFICDLQMVHDVETNWPDGRMNMVLKLFAAERGLRMPA
jgi:hypothetical protein